MLEEISGYSRACDCSISLLTSSVPNLSFDGFVVNFDAPKEINSHLIHFSIFFAIDNEYKQWLEKTGWWLPVKNGRYPNLKND